MGWEQRGNGRYYYEKVRENGRVVSRYIGKGVASLLFDAANEQARFERQEVLRERRARVTKDREIDGVVRELKQRSRALTETILIASGYHKHKGQWRRKRV